MSIVEDKKASGPIGQEMLDRSLREAYQELDLSSVAGESKAFLEKYGSVRVGTWLGYSRHGAADHPAESLTGQQLYDRIIGELRQRLCVQSDKPDIQRRFLNHLSNTLENYAPGKDGETEFQFWYTDFPSPRNTINGIVSNRDARQELVAILDKITLEKVRALTDPLIESGDNIYTAFSFLRVLPKEVVYGKQTSEFVEFINRLCELNRMRRSPELFDPKKTRREQTAIYNELQNLFSEAPSPVREAVIKMFSEMFGDK